MASEAMEQGQGGDQLQESERERVIRKIRRCLALGNSSNANEAETALRQARAMMDKYRLSEVDVALAEVGGYVLSVGKSRMQGWEKVLAKTAAEAFRCRVIICPGRALRLLFVGVMPAAELSAYAYDSLHAQLMLAKARYQRARPGVTRVAINDFCMAWVVAVGNKITEFAEANAGEADTQNALVVIQQKESRAISLWIEQKLGETKQETVKGRAMDADAAAMGRAAGSKAQLNNAIHGRKDDPLALAA
jgi:hypothetical protein